jgi:hypothetical protein
MSGFFSDIHGSIARPDVVMNSGPLPSNDSSTWPVGFNGNPDGRIGVSSELLEGVQPYSYGGPDWLSTQAAYLNIPHVTQRLVPAITIPKPLQHHMGGGTFSLNHQVDDGDIAFVIRCMFSPLELVQDKKKYMRQGVLFAIDPVVNLATVNYLMHGLQRYGWDPQESEWHTLWIALGISEHFGNGFVTNMERVARKCNLLLESDAHALRMTDAAKYGYMQALRMYRNNVCDFLIRQVKFLHLPCISRCFPFIS